MNENLIVCCLYHIVFDEKILLFLSSTSQGQNPSCMMEVP